MKYKKLKKIDIIKKFQINGKNLMARQRLQNKGDIC